MGLGKVQHFKIFEKFVKFLEDNNEFLKKISGDCHTSLGIKLIQFFSNHEECMKKVEDYMENNDNKLELGDYGYFDLSKIDGVSEDDLATWFSQFILDNGKTVGKGEVMMSILFSNVYKTPLGENGGGETGDLYISDDGGKTKTGRIEVKSALPGGFRFSDKITYTGLKKVTGGDELCRAYREFSEHMLGVAMDRDIFIRLCAYCIARYMHGQFRNSEDYWLIIFDNKPHINKMGNIHGTESRRIKKVILKDGERMNESVEDYDFEPLPYGDSMYDIPEWLRDDGYEVQETPVLQDAPTDSENGSEEMDVKNINGFIYIKRCDTLNETMKRILSLIDNDSAIYRENKSNRKNNFTFYADGSKLCIAHRDNPVLVNKIDRQQKLNI